MAPAYTLYTPQGSFRAFAPLIAAEFNAIDVYVETKGLETIAGSKSPTGKLPVLETPRGTLFTSYAIARYLASLRTDSGLLGSSFQERTSVNHWIDWASCEVELPACILFYPVAGYMPDDPRAREKAMKDFKAVLKILQDHLKEKEFLVGNRVTLADIVLVSTLLYPLKLVCDDSFIHPFDRVREWFTSCVRQPEFVAILGEIRICKATSTAPMSSANS